MQPNEARVFIIEDDTRKLGELTKLIEASEGQVVGSTNTLVSAFEVMRRDDFPTSVNDANIVLIDGNLSEHTKHGTDGSRVFSEGYERGLLHRVDTTENIGAVAIGCSIDRYSDVAYATGGNIDKLYLEDASARWAALLQTHTVEPVYLSAGAIERKDWSVGWRFDEMMEHIISPEDNLTVNILALTVLETKKQDGEEVTTYSDEVTEPTEVNYKEFVEKAGSWQGVENGYINVFSHTSKTILQTGEHVYVICHSGKVEERKYGVGLNYTATSDKIAVSSLGELPDSYWENLGIDRVSL